MHRVFLVLSTVLIILSCAASASAAPLSVAPTIDVRTDDWFPLPLEEMKRSAGDAALDRLTDAGRLRLAPDTDAGALELELALVGPAETAALTITLDVDGRPTLVSAATISVRGLDHAGIHRAFQHVGTEAADRLVAKLDLLGDAPAAFGSAASQRPLGDPERRARFDAAQQAKRAARYADARAGFETVVTTAPTAGDTLAEMAADELRYGLPVYEARQALNELGSAPLSRASSPAVTLAPIERAEHLFRQIRAENPNDAARVLEADRAIDEVSVVRNALANAFRAMAMTRISPIRMILTQHVMMEGRCPEPDEVRSITGADRDGVEIMLLESAGDGDARVYLVSVPDAATSIELACDRSGVRIR